MIDDGTSARYATGKRHGPGDSRQPADRTPAVRTFSSREVFGDRKEVLIIHGTETYRLRITSSRKLILTK